MKAVGYLPQMNNIKPNTRLTRQEAKKLLSGLALLEMGEEERSNALLDYMSFYEEDIDSVQDIFAPEYNGKVRDIVEVGYEGVTNEYLVLSIRKATGRQVIVEGDPETMDRCYCCGYLALPGREDRGWDICPICMWQDDKLEHDLDTISSANGITLRQAKKDFKAKKLSELEKVKFVKAFEGI